MLRLMIRIREGSGADRGAVVRLLERAALPLDGFDAVASLLVATSDDGSLVGSAALEEYRDGALLRSVAVDERMRGGGVGRQLTAAALDLAARHGHRHVYLLTTTGAAFFPRFGFERIDRAEVPDAVKTSIEFTAACPASAIVMRAEVRST
jgi:amino-acid N-acetyltransferase